LGIRIAAPAVGGVILLLILLAVLQYREVEQRAEETLDGYSELVGQLVLANLRDGMLANNRPATQGQLTHLQRLDPILEIRIVNKQGLVVFSSDETALGDRLDVEDPSCQACHAGVEKPTDRARTLQYEAPTGETFFRAVQPIVLEEQCTQCHDADAGQVIGVLITDLDEDGLTGNLRADAKRALWMVIAAFGFLVGGLILSVRFLIVARLRNLKDLLTALRSGARSMAFDPGARDEIDDVERLVRALTLDLDERVGLERAMGWVAPVLEHHQGPVVISDLFGHIVLANRHACAFLQTDKEEPVLGHLRAQWAQYDVALWSEREEEGWALAEDPTGPILLTLRGPSGALGILEVWPEREEDSENEADEPTPEDSEESLAEETDEELAAASEVAAPSVSSADDPAWLLYSTALLDTIGEESARWSGVLRFDRRIVVARRLLSELVAAIEGSRQDRVDVDLKSVGLISLWDVERELPWVNWHTLLDPEEHVVGSRHHLRTLFVRLSKAAGHQAGSDGHVVLFTQSSHQGERVFIGAWASAREDGKVVVIDPPNEPPLGAALSRAHGGSLEVDPAFDLTELAQNRRLKLPCGLKGVLFVVEIARDGRSLQVA